MKSYCLILATILIIGCVKKDIDKPLQIGKLAIESFYLGHLQEFRSHLDSKSRVIIDSLFQSRQLTFNNKYQVVSITEDAPRKKNRTTLLDCIVSVNNVHRDSLKLRIEVELDSFKIQASEEFLLLLLKYEGNVCNEIGKLLYSRKYFDASIKWFEQAVACKNYEAKYYLGKLYLARLKTSEAKILLEEAYKSGINDAGIELSNLYSFIGQRSMAIVLLKELANKGDSKAMVRLGDKYDTYFSQFGYDPPEDAQPHSSFYWYKKAAEIGDVSGMYNLGVIYDLGKYRSINHDSAFFWFLQAARLNDPMSMIEVGKSMISGKGTDRNFDDGWNWLVKAANFNKSLAFYAMGETYEQGLGIKPDKEKALEYYTIAKEAGSLDAARKIRELVRSIDAKI